MAPEVLGMASLEDSYTCTADFWSLGCTICAWLIGSTPFAAATDVPTLVRMILVDNITTIIPLHERIGIPERAFLEELLTRNPAERLGMRGHTQVLDHPWVVACAGTAGGDAE